MSEQCGCGDNMHEHYGEKTCSCGCGKHYHRHDEEGGCHCAEKFLEVADEAWKEVLKEKIKTKIIAKKGEHLDKLAEMVAEANGEKWKHMISAKMKCNEFKENLKGFFTSSCE